MYLTIKKKDSITSILLFVFNVFLVERGITEVPLKKIFRLLEPFKKNETAIRMGLSRGVQNGLLVNRKQDGTVYYQLTEEAIRSFDHWRTTMQSFGERVERQRAAWNGEWSMVALTASETKPERVNQFKDSLRQLGYGSVSGSLWLSPYDLGGDTVADLADRHKVDEQIYLFRGSLESNRSPDDLAAEAWPIQKLAERYNRYNLALSEAVDNLKVNTIQDEEVLPFLHLKGLELFEIIQDDPQLPLELLPPDWPGLQAAQTFWVLRKELLPRAVAYVEQSLGVPMGVPGT